MDSSQCPVTLVTEKMVLREGVACRTLLDV